MSGRKPLTRFCVEINGELKRLFSVREVKRGLLNITTDAVGTSAANQGIVERISAYKHTVHTSERSPTNANMIHMTQDFENGSKKEFFLLTHAIRDRLWAPIYQRAVLDPRSRPSLTPHHKDTLFSLAPFDPARSTLIYGLWISSSNPMDSFPASHFYSFVQAAFQRFSIAVAYGFAGTPSTERGSFIHYASSSPGRLTPAEEALGYRTGVSEGANPEFLERRTVHELNKLLEAHRAMPFRTEMMRQERVALLTRPEFSPTPP